MRKSKRTVIKLSGGNGRPRGRPIDNNNRSRSRSAVSVRSGLPNGRVVAGIHACAEVFKVRPGAISELWLQTPGGPTSLRAEIESLVRDYGTSVKVISDEQMRKVARGHQGIICFVTKSPEFDWNSMSHSDNQMVLVLDGIEDPQNFGAIMRTAWLLQVAAVFIPKDRAVGLTPTVAKVASGGIEHVPVVVCTNLADQLMRLKELGFWVFGLAEKGSRDLWQLNVPEKIVWVIGSEERGLRSTSERQCDELVRLLQAPGASSYNASVAAALASFETTRQWLSKKQRI